MKILICIVLLIITQDTQSRIRFSSMGERIKDSELIVLVDTFKKGDSKTIKIKKVLKGNKLYTNKIIKIKKVQQQYSELEPIIVTSATSNISWNKTNIILLSDSWQDLLNEQINWDYIDKEELSSVKRMLKVYRIKDERHRYKAFFKQVSKGDDYFYQQLNDEIGGMKTPKNFDLLINLFEQIDGENQIKLINQFGDINDLRAVPLLISAFASKHDDVKEAASHVLYYDFPGAEGVTNAFIKYRNDQEINYYASMYLKKRYKNIDIDLVSNNKPHPWHIAKLLIKNNKEEKAKDIYKQLISDTTQKKNSRLFSTKLLLEIANQEDKLFILSHMMPILEEEMLSSSRVTIERTIEIIRKLNTKKLLPMLLQGLLLYTANYDDTMISITFAIEELGLDARNQAVNKILSVFENRKPSGIVTSTDYSFITALAWLNIENDFQSYEGIFLPHILKKFDLILNKYQYGDEEIYLNSVLENIGSKRTQVENIIEKWVLKKLSEKENMKDISVLVDKLVNSNSGYPYKIVQVLSKIGNTQVSDEMMKLLDNANPNIRRNATEILAKSLKEQSVSVLVKMLKTDNFGNKFSAITYLGIYGNASHLDLLKPYCNFWDKSTYSWKACDAIADIRDRYNYDINGPIEVLDFITTKK